VLMTTPAIEVENRRILRTVESIGCP